MIKVVVDILLLFVALFDKIISSYPSFSMVTTKSHCHHNNYSQNHASQASLPLLQF